MILNTKNDNQMCLPEQIEACPLFTLLKEYPNHWNDSLIHQNQQVFNKTENNVSFKQDILNKSNSSQTKTGSQSTLYPEKSIINSVSFKGQHDIMFNKTVSLSYSRMDEQKMSPKSRYNSQVQVNLESEQINPKNHHSNYNNRKKRNQFPVKMHSDAFLTKIPIKKLNQNQNYILNIIEQERRMRFQNKFMLRNSFDGSFSFKKNKLPCSQSIQQEELYQQNIPTSVIMNQIINLQIQGSPIREMKQSSFRLLEDNQDGDISPSKNVQAFQGVHSGDSPGDKKKQLTQKFNKNNFQFKDKLNIQLKRRSNVHTYSNITHTLPVERIPKPQTCENKGAFWKVSEDQVHYMKGLSVRQKYVRQNQELQVSIDPSRDLLNQWSENRQNMNHFYNLRESSKFSSSSPRGSVILDSQTKYPQSANHKGRSKIFDFVSHDQSQRQSSSNSYDFAKSSLRTSGKEGGMECLFSQTNNWEHKRFNTTVEKNQSSRTVQPQDQQRKQRTKSYFESQNNPYMKSSQRETIPLKGVSTPQISTPHQPPLQYYGIEDLSPSNSERKDNIHLIYQQQQEINDEHITKNMFPEDEMLLNEYMKNVIKQQSESCIYSLEAEQRKLKTPMTQLQLILQRSQIGAQLKQNQCTQEDSIGSRFQEDSIGSRFQDGSPDLIGSRFQDAPDMIPSRFQSVKMQSFSVEQNRNLNSHRNAKHLKIIPQQSLQFNQGYPKKKIHSHFIHPKVFFKLIHSNNESSSRLYHKRLKIHANQTQRQFNFVGRFQSTQQNEELAPKQNEESVLKQKSSLISRQSSVENISTHQVYPPSKNIFKNSSQQ